MFCYWRDRREKRKVLECLHSHFVLYFDYCRKGALWEIRQGPTQHQNDPYDPPLTSQERREASLICEQCGWTTLALDGFCTKVWVKKCFKREPLGCLQQRRQLFTFVDKCINCGEFLDNADVFYYLKDRLANCV